MGGYSSLTSNGLTFYLLENKVKELLYLNSKADFGIFYLKLNIFHDFQEMKLYLSVLPQNLVSFRPF